MTTQQCNLWIATLDVKDIISLCNVANALRILLTLFGNHAQLIVLFVVERF
ncbi:hypothetical protein VII00023_10209 [Vibrio ichthyoenteri ATCC 700023]|uniref:Uncharacterized protein n=1 Tax=Vibrio ichthyoenteri ATCC 700023 TaxID=870968 RepID=F9S2F3_9VIBR|nr:hypothetical protein VII00023_10209 [Vibrio ichthyoenteri ATCC 700023]